MDQYPLHQAIISLSRDNQLPREAQQTMAAAFLPVEGGTERAITGERRKKTSLTSLDVSQVLADPNLLRKLLLGYTERLIALETQIADDAAKVAFHDAVVDSSNTETIQDVAKILGIGPAKFFEFLRKAGILMTTNLPYQCHIDAGYFKVIQSRWTDKNQEKHLYARSLVTGKGVAYLQKCYQNARRELLLAGGAAAPDQNRPALFATEA